jgi:hypothetical protein
MSLNPITNHRESSAMPQRVRDVLGRLKVSIHQNVYEADFEYGPQPLRWEQVTSGAGQVQAISSSGGVRMRVGNAAGDIALRQSRPYHRYQPGKTMFMATGCQLGVATVGQIQRVGFFDDANGVFFEQSVATPTNPYGMYVVVRSDAGGTVTETRIGLDSWNGDRTNISQLNFNRIQMFWIEYAWYGAGATRFGFWVNGEPFIAHQIGWGNYYNNNIIPPADQTAPWGRTGNLPVRYELRNINQVVPNPSDMYHYGVSVIVEGQRDDQRGFTYSYGFPNNAQTRTVTQSQVRVPILTIRGRPMGTLEYGNIYGRYDAGATTTAAAVLSATSSASYISGTTLTVGGTVTGTFAVGMGVTGLGIPLGTYISALGTGSGGVGTYTISNSVTLGSSTSTYAVNAYANTVTLTGTPLTANQFVGKNIYFPGLGTTLVATTNSSGTQGTTTITVASATNILVGAIVTGTGVQTQTSSYSVFTSVVAISGTTITLSTALTQTINSSSLTFTTTLGAGAMGRVIYNTTSTVYFVDPVTGTNLPVTPGVTAASFVQAYSSGGAAGATTVTVAAGGNLASIVAGQSVSGTGIQPGTKVEYVSGQIIGFSIPASTQISGNLTFTSGFVIGLANRGQLLPRRLMVSSDTRCLIEIIASTPTNPTVLTNPVFTPLSVLGSAYSFAERDVSATGVTGGEVVFAFTLAAASGLQDIDFSYFFPLYNNIRGSAVDTLSLCISGNGSASSVVAANLICQEAMS